MHLVYWPRLANCLSSLEFNLHMAKISTIGERAEDLFIVSSKDNTQLTQNQQVQFKARLNETLH